MPTAALATVSTLPPSEGYYKQIIVDGDGNIVAESVVAYNVARFGSVYEQTLLEIVRDNKLYLAPKTLSQENTDAMFHDTQYFAKDNQGNLYYTDISNVFELSKDPHGYGSSTVLYTQSFGNLSEPFSSGGVILDASGDLFGIEYDDSAGESIYEIEKSRDGFGPENVLYSLPPSNSDVFSGIVIDRSGNLFSARIDQTDGSGSIFELSENSSYTDAKTLATFDAGTETTPEGNLTVDPHGNIFGVTAAGGAFGNGRVFEIPNTQNGYGPLETLVSFDKTDGASPNGGLLVDAAGNLFGTTEAGGTDGDGTVFEVPKTATGFGDIRTLISFNGSNGLSPETGLIADAAGNLFGTTPTNNDGSATIFEITDSGFVACYCSGTLIAMRAREVPVENLRIGDELVTSSGMSRPIKWIGTRSYAGRFANGNRDVLPICFKAGSLNVNVPRRDLWVSPKHAMFIDGVLIPAEHLVNGVSVVQATAIDRVDYFHIELDSHDVIIAEGAESETFVDDGSRGIFHNALEFGVLYPDDEFAKPRYCAPRIENGYLLEAVRERLAEQAGISRCPGVGPGGFRGTLDYADEWRIEGWAQHLDHPEGAVCLDVLVDGVLVKRTLAHHYRDDLRAAGIGSGSHCFRLEWDTPLSRSQDHEVEVRRSADGAPLWCSPQRVNAASDTLEKTDHRGAPFASAA